MVNLGQNHLTGRIPLDLDKCANIRFLDFSMNKLTGWLSEELSVPYRVFGKCRKFSVVADLSDNLISGEIPADNSVKCCPVMVLNLSGNQITGIIPPSIGLLENLVVLDLGGNRLNGQMPVGLSSLKRLKYFSLGNNNFSGRNANALEQLHSLHKLELSSNYLSGISGGLLKLRGSLLIC
ncbi:hypothetical protein HPP92_000938 [Vanilla planifolia]|uniref:Uncharacterized protein n=1 Tax=Vanilla planifolia TaxID=51239 RepID=A0A835S383_VANPL|nr:hypothetical protein HPP92_000938 [Vanilla planifolia]